MDHETIPTAPIDLAPLYTTYEPALFRFFFQRTGNAQDAEDLVATTFGKALASLDRYREQGRLAAWLFSIARHTWLDERRRRSRAALTLLAPTLADPAPPPDLQALRAEQARQLRSLLEQLPADQREALLLRFFAEAEIGEIAERMGRSAGAIKMLIHRALARLRERYRQAEQATTQLFERCWRIGALAPSYAYAPRAISPYQRRRD
jgi:RNA polymerase sigma-70 factor (ECF subfamily)